MMLQLHNINVWFGKKHVLKNLSCTIQKGDCITIVGTNGAGKSTFFDIISGKLQPTSGSIILNGKDITHLSEQERSSLITRIFQNPQLNCVGSFTVIQNLALALYSRRYATLQDGMQGMHREYAKKLLRTIAIPETLLDTPMQKLSGGQRQRIAFVMATLLIPEILLLDEPTAALDPQAATALLVYAAHFIKTHQLTSLLITHDPHIALNMGNKIWILDNGTITKEYTEKEKNNLNAEQLIGSIDYKKLKESNMM